MIRPAKAIDRPELMDLLKDGFKRSRYASKGKIAEKHTEQLLLAMVMKHGIKAVDGTWCMVATHAGKIVGMHFAAKQRVQLIGNRLLASDAFFYVKPGHPFQAGALLKSFEDWAWSDPKVIEILPGFTDLMQDYRIAGKIYEARGYKQAGAIYRLEAAA